jgi:fluoride exporter
MPRFILRRLRPHSRPRIALGFLVYFLVAAGSAAGGAARYAASGFAGYSEGGFPWGTLAVNISGSFVIGLFFGVTGTGPLFQEAPPFDQMFTYGFLGGYTTFSTFTLEALNLLRDGEHLRASVYLIGSVITCLSGVALGYMVMMLL